MKNIEIRKIAPSYVRMMSQDMLIEGKLKISRNKKILLNILFLQYLPKINKNSVKIVF